MNVYKITALVIDFDGLGADEVSATIQNTRYPNHCISPAVMRVETADIGEWDDDHPLNRISSMAPCFARMFPSADEDLLEALEDVVGWMESPANDAFSDSRLAKARAAIAKAKGE